MIERFIRAPRLTCTDTRQELQITRASEQQRFGTTDCAMGFNTLFFLLITSCVCLALAQVAYDDCCLKYVTKMGHGAKKHAVDYREQVTDGGCNIPATIFKMRRGREVCTNPRELWVIELKERIDIKKARSGPFRKAGSRRPYKG
ncbi:C-C motif chemokine 4 [Acanthopagrus schlegelii]